MLKEDFRMQEIFRQNKGQVALLCGPGSKNEKGSYFLFQVIIFFDFCFIYFFNVEIVLGQRDHNKSY